jgi:hypothetical protein
MQRQLERVRLVFGIEQVRQRRAGYPGIGSNLRLKQLEARAALARLLRVGLRKDCEVREAVRPSWLIPTPTPRIPPQLARSISMLNSADDA